MSQLPFSDLAPTRGKLNTAQPSRQWLTSESKFLINWGTIISLLNTVFSRPFPICIISTYWVPPNARFYEYMGMSLTSLAQHWPHFLVTVCVFSFLLSSLSLFQSMSSNGAKPHAPHSRESSCSPQVWSVRHSHDPSHSDCFSKGQGTCETHPSLSATAPKEESLFSKWKMVSQFDLASGGTTWREPAWEWSQ